MADTLALIFTLIAGSLAGVLPIRSDTKTTTVTLPPGVTYNPDTHLFCAPTKWTDVATFFLGNYISHAATVITFPGEPWQVVALNMLLAIVFPGMGAARGLLAIIRHAALCKDPIQRALRSRAMCMVVRSKEWKPSSGQKVHSLTFLPGTLRRNEDDEVDGTFRAHDAISKNKESAAQYLMQLKEYHKPIGIIVESPGWLTLEHHDTYLETVGEQWQVFGDYHLPTGYKLAYVPPNAIVEPMSSTSADSTSPEKRDSVYNLSSLYSFSTALVAIGQIIYASATLYRSRGDQVARYGYAAYGFTVLPYLTMSFVNLVGNLCTPAYSTLYLVRTEMMDEAVQRGGYFEGTIAKLEGAQLHLKQGFVFEAELQEHEHQGDEERWEFKVGDVDVGSGDDELEKVKNAPVRGAEVETAADDGLVVQHDGASSKESAEEETKGEKTVKDKSEDAEDAGNEKAIDDADEVEPLLVIPSCYNFKSATQSRGFLSSSNPILFSWSNRFAFWTFQFLIAAVPFVIIGAMSRFKANHSTTAQRAWIMSWMSLGMTLVLNAYLSNHVVRMGSVAHKNHRRWRTTRSGRWGHHFASSVIMVVGTVYAVCLLAVPAIGGFTMVVKMLREDGSCTLIG
ncbi:uncharacterized protein PFLUO_LOCUS5332 [Penicillium psychrofluorescens]|uniref:uncharacterized protein n=1 Tax=Penicillium psychrofluorescens TaxID=3158075 RepID=UPI003CCD2329